MAECLVAFNRETRVATILDGNAPLPEGSVEAGRFNASALGSASDASHQHILTMLHRQGITDTSSITIERAGPVKDTGDDRSEGAAIAESIEPQLVSLRVGEETDLVNGSTKGFKFDVDGDDETVKLDKRGGKVTALKAGTATVTVEDAEGITNQVVITVHEPVAPASETGSGEGTGSDAKEAETA